MALMMLYITPNGVEKPIKSCEVHGTALALEGAGYYRKQKKKPPDGEAFFT
jgi:hypothetical protein